MSSDVIYNLSRIKQIPGTAIFSDDNLYRYTLTRQWGDNNKFLNVLLCNPSTADAFKLDPTVHKCLIWAITWGYDGLVVTNIFAYRSTDPSKLNDVDDPVGKDNNKYILETFDMCKSGMVLCGWSNKANLLNRGEQVLELAQKYRVALHAVKVNNTGHPQHPLYLALSSKPFLWKNYIE